MAACGASGPNGSTCARHAGHDREPHDTGHRARGVDGGYTWASLESARREARAFVAWLRRQGEDAIEAEDGERARRIAAMVAEAEAMFLAAATPPPT